jgi:hypothetical protein
MRKNLVTGPNPENGYSALLALQVGARDVDLAGPVLGAEEQAAAALLAEAALGLGRRPMPLQHRLRTVGQLQRFGGKPCPGDKRGAMGALAHRAVAVRDPLRRQRQAEPQGAAQAGALHSITRRHVWLLSHAGRHGT